MVLLDFSRLSLGADEKVEVNTGALACDEGCSVLLVPMPYMIQLALPRLGPRLTAELTSLRFEVSAHSFKHQSPYVTLKKSAEWKRVESELLPFVPELVLGYQFGDRWGKLLKTHGTWSQLVKKKMLSNFELGFHLPIGRPARDSALVLRALYSTNQQRDHDARERERSEQAAALQEERKEKLRLEEASRNRESEQPRDSRGLDWPEERRDSMPPPDLPELPDEFSPADLEAFREQFGKTP